jgi:hypothetical protein
VRESKKFIQRTPIEGRTASYEKSKSNKEKRKPDKPKFTWKCYKIEFWNFRNPFKLPQSLIK